MRSTRLGLWALGLCLFPAVAPAAPLQPVVTGTVLTEDGRPLSGAQVELQSVLPSFAQLRPGPDAVAEPTSTATAATDAAGRFSLQAPASGLWALTVQSAGRAPVRQTLPLVEPVELAPAVLAPNTGASPRLTDPAGSRQVRLNGDPPVLSGQVLVAGSRKPVPGALLWSPLDPGAFVRTDSQGRFRLVSPLRRRLDLEVVAAGHLPKRATIPGAQLASGRRVTLLLDPAATVLGRVVDPQGRPLAGVAVSAVAEAVVGERAFAATDPVADRAFTDAQGRFVLRRLHPEEGYEVRASRQGAFPAAERTTVGPATAPPRNLTLVLAPARPARGRVQDREGRPIAGAEILLRPALRRGQEGFSASAAAGGNDAIRAESDPQGTFLVPECPAVEVELLVRKKGFAPMVLPALRIPPAGGPADKGPADLGLFVLRPGVRLAGRVVGGNGRGVPGAEIFPLDRPPVAHQNERAVRGLKPAATTALDGVFALEDLAGGTPVHLLVRAPGYLTAVVRAVRPPTAAPLKIRLESEEVLRGRVVDEAGEPVAGARLDLRWQDHLEEEPERRIGTPLLRMTRSEADGRFELREIPEGSVSLGAAAPGFVALAGMEIELPRPADAGELRLVLDRGAVVQGRVTSAEGEPVAAVRVAVEGAAATTDDDGFYWLEGAATGPRDVLFLHPRYGRLAKPFDVQPGVNGLDASFAAGVEVSGRVLDEAGKPVAGARVELGARGPGSRQYQDVSGEDGRFRLSPVVDAVYRLQAEAAGFSATDAPGTVEVAGESIANLEITLERGAVLSGEIVGLAPEDLAGVKIEARGDLGATVAGWTDGRGRYEIRPLRSGDWTVRATLWEGQRQAQVRLVIRRTDREVTRDVEFEPRLTLTAQVLYDDEPLPEAQVSLRGQRIAAERIATTDYEGRVQIDDLLPDTYRLGVNHPGKMLVHNGEIDLRHDQEQVIRLRTSTISGLVVGGDGGKPVAQALVAIRPVEGPEFMVASGTKADGRFGLYRVPPGRYHLTASAEGFLPLADEVEVAAGELLDDLELRLQPAAGAEIQVRLASGQVPEFVHLLVHDPAGAVVLAESRRPDETGIVKITKLGAGAWTATLQAQGAGRATVQLLIPSDPLAVTLPPAGSLSVRVPDLVTSELTGTVRLVGADQQPLSILAAGGQIEQQWPLVAGRGLIEGVPAGTWLVYVAASDGQQWQGTATTAGAGVAAVVVE